MIYFLQAGEHVKIGRTKDADTLKRRLSFLQTGQAHRLLVLRTIDAPDWAEGWLHGFFSGVHAAGEWFRYHPEMMDIAPPNERPAIVRRSKIGRNSYMTGQSYQLAVRLPKWVYNRAVKLGPNPTVAIVAALCELWGPPPDDKAARDDKAA